MVYALLELLRRRYLMFQLLAIFSWLIIEVSGYGFGVLDALFRPRLTNADGGGIGVLLGNAPPAGPVRLSRSERGALQQRLTASFADTLPKYVVLSDLKTMYALKPGSWCDWRGGNVASDPKECNQLSGATPLFRALLASMHPKTEALMLEEVRGFKGDVVNIAFFVGHSGKPQILFDLSQARTDQWDVAKGFKLKVYHGKGLTDLALGKELYYGSRLFLIDDPGRLERRRGLCGEATCPAQFLLYGFDHQNGRDTEGKYTTQNLADFAVGSEIEKRFDLYAVLLDQRVTLPVPLPQENFKPERFGVTKFETVRLDRPIEALFGTGAKDRVLYSPIAYRVAFGTVYGIMLDGKLYALWDGGPGYASLGTDRFVFDVVENGKQLRLGDVTSAGGVYLLTYSGPETDRSARLEVRKFVDQSQKAWSEFSDFTAVFAPLRTQK